MKGKPRIYIDPKTGDVYEELSTGEVLVIGVIVCLVMLGGMAFVSGLIMLVRWLF